MRAVWWWVDRWRKSTAFTDLTLAEQGAYRNLLDELWIRDGCIPNDERTLARASGDPVEWPAVRDKVLKNFRLTEEGWRNDTHDEIMAESQRRALKQKRYRERVRTGDGNVTRSPSPSPSPSIRHRTDRGAAGLSPLPERRPEAAEIWIEVAQDLRSSMAPHSWATWIRPLEGWAIVPSTDSGAPWLWVVCPPGDHLTYVPEAWGSEIEKAMVYRGLRWRLVERTP